MIDARAVRAERIRIARARFQLRQAELAQLAGLDQTTISKAEQGKASDATYDLIDEALEQVAS